MTKLFEKDYDGEDLYDLSRDMHEAFKEDFNPIAKTIPRNEHGIHLGTFKVTIEWVNE